MCVFTTPFRYSTLELEQSEVTERLEETEGRLAENEAELVQAREENRSLTDDLKASQGKVSTHTHNCDCVE